MSLSVHLSVVPSWLSSSNDLLTHSPHTLLYIDISLKMCILPTTVYFIPNQEMSIFLVFTSEGKPSPVAERVAPLCQVGQADSGSVSGPTWAASPGRQCQLTPWLFWDYAGDERTWQEKDPWQVAVHIKLRCTCKSLFHSHCYIWIILE